MSDSSKKATETAAAKAEDLRLQGNDAFKTQDYERAVQLYEASVAASPPVAATAKTYSNLAAALCKLGKYEEACKAADRATVLDPKWAKGWWRRGTCLELTKDFAKAKNCYKIAVKRAPKEKEFRKAFKKISERLGIKGLINGYSIVDPVEAKNVPVSAKAYLRAHSMLRGGSYLSMTHRFRTLLEHDLQNPTSFEWLFGGFIQWVGGIKGAVAEFAKSTNRESAMAYQQLSNQAQHFGSQEEFLAACEQLLGGYPDNNSMNNSFSGFSHLGGVHVFLNTGLSYNPTNDGPPIFTPPRHEMHPAYQMLAALWSIYSPLRYVVDRCGFDRNIKISKGIITGVNILFANLGGPSHELNMDMEQDPTPEEMVEYIKQQLNSGKTWDSGIRRYVSLNYRGTVLFAAIYRLILPAQMAESYKFEKWANDFIALLDREFQVTATESFEEKGTAFRPSLRVGSLISQLMSLEVLRCGQINGPYSMEMALDLCLDIIEMAERVSSLGRDDEYYRVQDEVAFRRKPLALANSVIAAHLNQLKAIFSPEDFKSIVLHHGLIENEDIEVDPFALMAKHYEIAAENELPDDDQGSMLWWGAAASMAQANPSSRFTLGQLRRAIRMAEAAERARDIGLFGENQYLGGSFETLSRITSRFYDKESDDFVLPQVNLIPPVEGGSPTSYLEVEGHIICSNFDEYDQADHENYEASNKDNHDRMSTSDVERKHGQTHQGVPSLEILCIRQLHKSGHEFAKGHHDGAEIIYNAMASDSLIQEQ